MRFFAAGSSCDALGRRTRRLSSVRSTVTPASTLPTVRETSILAALGCGREGPMSIVSRARIFDAWWCVGTNPGC